MRVRLAAKPLKGQKTQENRWLQAKQSLADYIAYLDETTQERERIPRKLSHSEKHWDAK